MFIPEYSIHFGAPGRDRSGFQLFRRPTTKSLEEESQSIAAFTKRAIDAWKKIVGSPHRAVKDRRTVEQLFNAVEVYPPRMQISEMLEFSRDAVDQEPRFTIGAFTFYAAEMKFIDAREKFFRNARTRFSTGSPHSRKYSAVVKPFTYDVFLGGSCNPTQWRRDEAIPAFEKATITYYNPQRNDWYPELVDQERRAKENAQLLLFVHDKETRALASMVEVAEMANSKRHQLVVALEDVGDKVMGQQLSARELSDMRRARSYLRDIAEACRIRVHNSILGAVQTCIETIYRNRRLKESGHREEKLEFATQKQSTGRKSLFMCGPEGALSWKSMAAERFSKSMDIRERVNDSADRLGSHEMEMIESSDILLFVFPEDTWGAPEMIMASHFMARGKKVVLCVQECKKGHLVNGEPLSETQAKDYNRGREYLAESAVIKGITVHRDLEQALRKVHDLARQ